MDADHGLVQVYTGDGKGKTTAAIGLAIRALGASKKVMFLQFMKAKSYSEHNILPSISPNFVLETVGKPFFIAKEGSLTQEQLDLYGTSCVVFPPGQPPQAYVELISKGIKAAKLAASSGQYDLVVLDEINCALFFELVSWKEIKEIIEKKNDHTELVLTGRGAPQELIEIADLVTEMKEIKHYFNKGIMARKGIEN